MSQMPVGKITNKQVRIVQPETARSGKSRKVRTRTFRSRTSGRSLAESATNSKSSRESQPTTQISEEQAQEAFDFAAGAAALAGHSSLDPQIERLLMEQARQKITPDEARMRIKDFLLGK